LTRQRDYKGAVKLAMKEVPFFKKLKLVSSCLAKKECRQAFPEVHLRFLNHCQRILIAGILGATLFLQLNIISRHGTSVLKSSDGRIQAISEQGVGFLYQGFNVTNWY